MKENNNLDRINWETYHDPEIQRFAEQYYGSVVWDKAPRKKAIEQTMKLQEGDKLLDVGCALGPVVIDYAKKGHRCVGADYSEMFIRKAREIATEQQVGTCDFLVMDGRELALKDNSFEWVLCSEVLEHVSDDNKVARELVRVSSKYVVITVPVRSGLTEISDKIVDVAKISTFLDNFLKRRSLFYINARHNRETHHRYYTPQKINELFDGLPVDIIDINYFGTMGHTNGIIALLKKQPAQESTT